LNSSSSGTGSYSSSEGGDASGVLAAYSLISREGARIFFMVRGSNNSGSGSWVDSGCSCLLLGVCFVAEDPKGRKHLRHILSEAAPKLSPIKLRRNDKSQDEGVNRLKDE
jgi:hypothetical protein